MRKNKKELTPEQIARREEKRAAVRQIAARIKAMSEADRINFACKYGLRTIEARELSPFNQCLVLFQNPDASCVGGFRQWIKNGRAVRKGERGLSIWVPTGRKSENPETGDTETDKVGFVLGTVFDIAQTDEIESEVLA